MTKLDLYWESNKDWYTREGFEYKIKDTAPDEAKKSFERYKSQLQEKDKQI